MLKVGDLHAGLFASGEADPRSPAAAPAVASLFRPENLATLFHGDCRLLLGSIPDRSVQLFVTSPPYNIGKAYESKLSLGTYLESQADVISRCVQKLAPGGSICWQVGNHVDQGEVFPLDILLYPLFKGHGLRLRNRIIWHFEHGLHCSRRFSGRHETILWFSREDATDSYHFDLDPVRVPQKYPGKRFFKGPRKGEYSANPLGKNPGDVWVIPNVKHNHPEKTIHPCQFPIELVERLLLSLTAPGDLIVDPFMGVGTTVAAAILHGRRGAGADLKKEYVAVAADRVRRAGSGDLAVRPRNRPVYTPAPGSKLTTAPWMTTSGRE